MITQRNPLGNDLSVQVVQANLKQLFEAGHEHTGRSAAPSERDGANWDIVPVELNGSAYLYIKFPSLGWKRVLLS
jgi:hypothetical protein